MINLSEKYQFIPVIESKDYGGAGIDGDSINMGKVHGVALVFVFGAITGDSTLKVYSGASAGTKTTAETFYYRLGGGDYKAASADILGALTSGSASLTLTAATYDHKILVVEVDPADFADDKPWMTVEISATANPINVGCVGVAQPRYPSNTQVSSLT